MNPIGQYFPVVLFYLILFIERFGTPFIKMWQGSNEILQACLHCFDSFLKMVAKSAFHSLNSVQRVNTTNFLEYTAPPPPRDTKKDCWLC